jgi:tetratricopeptide (TPR) repeat protein
MDRIAVLKSFIERNPNDPFPRYGLGMEYRNRGQADEAVAVFSELMERFPDYTATYLMSGQTLVGLGRREDATRVFELGIAACQRKGDGHTRGELESALAELSG